MAGAKRFEGVSICWLMLAVALMVPSVQAQAMPPAKVVTDFLEARALVERRPAEAYRLAATLPEIEGADEVRWQLRHDAARAAGLDSEAVQALEALERSTERQGERFEVRLERAELLAKLGQRDAAQTLVSVLLRERDEIKGPWLERRDEQARLLRLAHDLAVAAGRTEAARGFATSLLVELPAEIPTKAPGLSVTPEALSDGQRWRRAGNQFDGWDYAGARAEYERVKNNPERHDEAIWKLGLIGLRKLRDRPAEAEQYFLELSQPGKPRAEASLFLLARAYMVQERYDEARSALAEYVRRYPKGEEVMLADYFAGWLFYDHRENEQAIVGFNAFIDKYGRKAEKSSYVYGFRAWAYMRLGQWEKAIESWDTLLPFGNPLMEGKAYYWQAYAQAKLGKKELAIARLDRLRDRWPLTYYGMLGEQLRAELSGGDARASAVWWPRGGGATNDAPRVDVYAATFAGLKPEERQHWERVKTLAALGEGSAARSGFAPLRTRLLTMVPRDEKQAWTHALDLMVGDYHHMWQDSWNSIAGFPGMVSPTALRSVMAYPRAYREVVEGVASEFGLYPGFVYSIMRQESRFNPAQISGTDAMGALQMQPETARKVASEIGVTFNLATFPRPEVGFRYSGFYMRKLVDNFSGLYVPAAAAYNTGPGPIARWFRKNPDATFPWLIEEFEYNEGRAYGRKVVEHMLRYLYLYEPDAAVRGAVLDKMFPLSRDITLPDDVGY